MATKLEELENKIKDVDTDQLTEITQEVEKAFSDEEITEKEKDELIKMTEERLGEPFTGHDI